MYRYVNFFTSDISFLFFCIDKTVKYKVNKWLCATFTSLSEWNKKFSLTRLIKLEKNGLFSELCKKKKILYHWCMNAER